MSPAPFVEPHVPTQHERNPRCRCADCQPVVMRGYAPIVTHAAWILAALLVAAVVVFFAFSDGANAREGVKPQPRPVVLKARALCSVETPKLECRAELRKSLAALAWQKHQRKRLHRRLQALQPVQHLAEWTCIHRGEGAWNSNTSNGYFGGLQMDWSFMRTYGSDMLAKYGGAAHLWTPRDQMIVAERAYDAGRGFHPWPNTARACGLR